MTNKSNPARSEGKKKCVHVTRAHRFGQGEIVLLDPKWGIPIATRGVQETLPFKEINIAALNKL